MCNSPFSALYVFWIIGFVLFFVIMRSKKNNKSDSEGKSNSKNSSSTIDKLSKIKPLNESNTPSESTERKEDKNSEKTESKIIIAPREERLTKEEIARKYISSSNKEPEKLRSNTAESKPEIANEPQSSKKKFGSYFFIFLFGAIGRIATLVSFIFVNLNSKLDIKDFVLSIIAFLMPVIGGLYSLIYWGYIIIGTFIKPFLSYSNYIISIICLSISSFCFAAYLYNKSYDDNPSNRKRSFMIFTFTIIPLIIIALSFSFVQINSSSNSLDTNSYTSIRLNNKSSRVSPGENAHISVTGKPNTEYSIIVDYPSGHSEAEGLYNKTSDSKGVVSWTWEVGTRTTPGTYPITITDLSTYDFDTYYFTVE